MLPNAGYGEGVRIEKEQIVVEDCVTEICSYFDIDPYTSISEGTLIIASQKGIRSSIVGELIEPEKGMVLVEGRSEKKLEHPIVDPFWKAFYDALDKYKA